MGDVRVERVQAQVEDLGLVELQERIAELSLEQSTLVQEVNYLRERNVTMELAMASAAALFLEAVSEPSS